MISDLADDIPGGLVITVDCDLPSVLVIGERISKTRTVAGGHCSFDILHVATALELDAAGFLSFDANQNSLASAEGLATPLAGSVVLKPPRKSKGSNDVTAGPGPTP